MPRTARAIQAGLIYHVLNRGNGRMRLFHKDEDYAAFARVLAEGLARYPVDLLTYCLMPNHWHLVLRPREGKSLGRLLGWVGVTHVRRHHEHYRTRGGGHLYQGRFKSFPTQDDHHFLTLCRYVEANPLRAGLVKRAEHWPWCGLWLRRQHHGRMTSGRGLPGVLGCCDWPVDRPRDWTSLVNQEMPADQLDRLRVSVNRGRPWGGEDWVERTARRLGLLFTLREAGRPPKVIAPGVRQVNNQ